MHLTAQGTSLPERNEKAMRYIGEAELEKLVRETFQRRRSVDSVRPLLLDEEVTFRDVVLRSGDEVFFPSHGAKSGGRSADYAIIFAGKTGVSITVRKYHEINVKRPPEARRAAVHTSAAPIGRLM